MEFILLLTLNGTSWDEYGPNFDITAHKNIHTVCYPFENGWDDADFFFDDLNDINRQCDSLLSYGDIEYFNAKQCEVLLKWVKKRLLDNIPSRYRELLEVLDGFCQQAINLRTGVYIDL